MSTQASFELELKQIIILDTKATLRGGAGKRALAWTLSLGVAISVPLSPLLLLCWHKKCQHHYHQKHIFRRQPNLRTRTAPGSPLPWSISSRWATRRCLWPLFRLNRAVWSIWRPICVFLALLPLTSISSLSSVLASRPL